MVSEPIISVSGLRGIVGESLTPEIALRYACALAAAAPPGPLVITRDGRTTGPMLADAISAGLRSVGRDVLDAGVAATPTTGVLVRTRKAAGGIQISASHNPPTYNGMKLFSHHGRVIPASEGQTVIDRYRSTPPKYVAHDQIGKVLDVGDNLDEHLQILLNLVDVDRIRDCRFRVLLDANHGAGSVIGVPLLDALGCRTTVLGGEPDGLFGHVPEPTAENLASVLSAVVFAKADIGFCQDPDADRLAVIDAAGNYVGEEYTPAICVEQRLRQTKGPIVTNCSTSRMSQDIAERHGVPFVRSAVGEANVVDAMLKHKALLGAEGNGGVIDPRVVLVRDSLLSMALILDAMAARERSVAELAAELPRYEIVKRKISLDSQKLAAGFEALKRHFSQAKSDTLDGLRFDWPDKKWLLVRASNTEPIVRAIAEATTAAAAEALCDQAADVLGAAY